MTPIQQHRYKLGQRSVYLPTATSMKRPTPILRLNLYYLSINAAMLSRNKKEEESGELGIFTHIDKALVIQDVKIFNETPLKIDRCITVLTKLLYLLYQGEKLNSKDSTNVFFAVIKSFQSKEVNIY